MKWILLILIMGMFGFVSSNLPVVTLQSNDAGSQTISVLAGVDTNASNCDDAEVLLGNGTCSVGTFLAGPGIDTDTNVTTACAGATVWLGNGTCSTGDFLSGVGTETDPYWLSNYTTFNETWGSMFNESYYLITNPYEFYNSTTLTLIDTNASTACAGEEYLAGDGTCKTVGSVETDSICSSYEYYNSTDFSIADYYLDSNPYSFYNSTTLPEGSDTNETPRVNELYSFGYYNSTDFSIADYYLDSNPYGFYNSTNPSPDTNFSSGGVSTGDINISGANLYISEDQTFCLSQTCESNITFNGTHSIWH